MEKNAYEMMFRVEDNYWWYVALRSLVFSYIDSSFPKQSRLRILDAGCGTGGLLGKYGAHHSYGLDYSQEALKFCKIRNLSNMIRASVCDIPFSDDSFDLVVSLDVLYHQGVRSDRVALEEFNRVLAKNGLLIINLPAFGYLLSEHDKAIHTKHRYSCKELKKKIIDAGFKPEIITYRNALLFPIFLVIRLMKRIFLKPLTTAQSDLKPLPPVLNKLLTQILLLENKLIISGLNFPLGLSVFSIARKRDSSDEVALVK